MDSIELALITMFFISICLIKYEFPVSKRVYIYVQYSFNKMFNILTENFYMKFIFTFIGVIYYLHGNFFINYLLNIFFLIFLINLYAFSQYIKFLRRIRHKDVSTIKLNRMMLVLIEINMKFYFAIFFYFVIAGIPIAILYFYSIYSQNKKINEYLLYLPTRVLWLLMVFFYLIYSQGADTTCALNWKYRNITNKLNGTWIESIVSGMLGIQLANDTGTIVIGNAKRSININDLIRVFYFFAFAPYLLIILKIL